MSQDFDYAKAKQDLESIISWFEDSNHDLNESFEKYQKAQDIITKLEQYLKDSQAKLKIVSKKTSS